MNFSTYYPSLYKQPNLHYVQYIHFSVSEDKAIF